MNRRVAYVSLQQFCEHDDQPLRILSEAGFEVRRNTSRRRLQPEELAEALQDADAVVAGVERYDAGLLKRLRRLRCISRCGSGTDNIDREAAEQRGIAVFTTAEEVVEPVAQMAVAMMLALARNLPQHARDASTGVWTKRFGCLLSEWTIGLVGYGRIGRAVTRLLQPFHPRILAADPQWSPADIPPYVERRPLESLLAEADLVSLHAARPQDEGPILGARELARMKPGSLLVNTARGYLVDEHALHECLMSGRLAGAALDVFEVEPYAGPLTALPQVLCTPHVSTLTHASRAAMERRAAEHVVEYFAKRLAVTAA